MTMITPSYLGETIEYSSLHACRSTLEDPKHNVPNQCQQEPCAIAFHLFASSPRNDSPVSCSSRAMAVSYSATFCQ